MATKKVKETDYLTDEALQAKDLYTRYSNCMTIYTREENKYKDQTESLGQQLINYKPFTYDINSDVSTVQYKDQYQKLGQQAMADTMGQAAALTGGYGNSYAATVGNQAYQSYLQQLYDRIPELYNMALNNYNTNRSNLESALATASQLYNMEENRIDNDYQLLVDKYNAYMSRYDTLSNRDYTAYSDALALAEQQRQFNAQMAEDQRQFNANLAYQREADNYAKQIAQLQSAYDSAVSAANSAKEAEAKKNQLASNSKVKSMIKILDNAKDLYRKNSNVLSSMPGLVGATGKATNYNNVSDYLDSIIETRYNNGEINADMVAYLKAYYGIN